MSGSFLQQNMAKRTSKPQTDQHALLRSLTFAQSQVFIAELQNAWQTSRESARLALAATPATHKREVLLSHVDQLGGWLFTHIRQSLVARFEVARNATTGQIKKKMAWCNEDVEWDMASALIPDGGDKDDLPVPWAGVGSAFYFRLVADWVRVACAGWEVTLGKMVDWRAPGWTQARARESASEVAMCSAEQTGRFLWDIAISVKEQFVRATDLAYEQALDIHLSTALADNSGGDAGIQAKLKRKILSISDYDGMERLTDLQHRCLSLRLEHELTPSEIATHLQRDRKTIHGHLDAAVKKLTDARERTLAQKNLARVKPGGPDRRR
jgi:DNA-binding CsgD family transcriptional regulator